MAKAGAGKRKGKSGKSGKPVELGPRQEGREGVDEGGSCSGMVGSGMVGSGNLSKADKREFFKQVVPDLYDDFVGDEQRAADRAVEEQERSDQMRCDV